MSADLAPGIWFVRSNGGGGSYPVAPEGWAAVRRFVAGVALSAGAALVVGLGGASLSVPGSAAVGGVLFAAGMAWSAWRFIDTARKHTDYSVTYSEYARRKSA